MRGISKRTIGLLCAAVLLCGALHVLLYRVEYFRGIINFYCGCILLVWARSVQKRVTDRRLRALLLGIAALLMVVLVMQEIRYDLIWNSPNEERYLWYSYYFPLTTMPLLCMALALQIHRPPEQPLPFWFRLEAAAAVLLTLGVLTNDLHMQFMYFPGPVWEDDGSEVRGWLFYAANLFIYANYFAAFFLLLRKSRVFQGQRYRWLPLVPLCAALLYFALYPLKIGLLFFPCRIWNIGEVLVLCMISALECCIQTGLIPANTDYERLFTMAKLSAVILDEDERPRYLTAGTVYPFRPDETLQIMRHPIHGGEVVWAADVARLQEINRTLAEAAQQIEVRNACLTAETKIRAEKAEMETRNRIYDNILRAVRPQLSAVSALLDRTDESFDARLRRIAVLSAYVKRRSNMELLAEAGTLPARELQLALNESSVYLRGMGIAAAAAMDGGCLLPAGMLIEAYEQAEQLIEQSLDSLNGLMFHVLAEPGTLTLRMLLQSREMSLKVDEGERTREGYSRSVSFTKDGQDLLLVFRYAEGGAA